MVPGLVTCALKFPSACYDRVCVSPLVMRLLLLIVLSRTKRFLPLPDQLQTLDQYVSSSGSGL